MTFHIVRAAIDTQGKVKLLEPVTLEATRNALVIVLDDTSLNETALMSEAALMDWERPEEEAWAPLQPER